MGLRDKLQELYNQLMDRDNEILVQADELGDPELFESVVQGMVSAAQAINGAMSAVKYHLEEKDKAKDTLSAEAVDELAEFATALDMSCDEDLQKKAAVIDQLLLNLGVTQTADNVSKAAQEEEVARLRKEYRAKSLERPYEFPSEELERDIKAAEAAKAIKESIKEYRPLETNLSTRYCPDHPGTSVIRIADDTYQCPLDKGIYNYREGFTTMKGNKVPGTDVQHQTRALGDRILEPTHFDTRETRLTE